ncbi:SPASM domain-containing protein, partial [Candidatus Dojkabacteria bacterium]|nr:SPASM domain-containing protein [Candidatus Dojkabacteria bacterium]
ADLLSKYNWQRFQVTLDGPPESHNKRRILKNGGETFDKIIENIKYILDNNKIEKISLRINYDKGNVDKIPEFLEYVAKNFDKDRIILSLGFISKTVDDTDANKYVSKYGIKKGEISKYYLPLYEKAVELGFQMSDLFMLTGMCTSKLDNALVISSNGDIFKCLSGVGRNDFIEGNVDSNQYDLPNYLYPELYKECMEKECPYLPLCHTGCRFESYLKDGEKKEVDCNKEVLDSVNMELLKYLYLKK